MRMGVMIHAKIEEAGLRADGRRTLFIEFNETIYLFPRNKDSMRSQPVVPHALKIEIG
jgi:hypothetical protein